MSLTPATEGISAACSSAGEVTVFDWTGRGVQRHSDHLPIVADRFQVLLGTGELLFGEVGHGVRNAVVFQRAKENIRCLTFFRRHRVAEWEINPATIGASKFFD